MKSKGRIRHTITRAAKAAQAKTPQARAGDHPRLDRKKALDAAARLDRVLIDPMPESGEWKLFLAGACADLQSALGEAPKVAGPTATHAPPFDARTTEHGIEATVTLQFSTESCERFRKAYLAYTEGMVKPIGMAEYVMMAVSARVAQDLCPGAPLLDLEEAVNQAIGFMNLAGMRLSELESDMEYKLADRAGCGVNVLAQASCARLNDAFSAAFSFAAGKTPE
jgi:hypothetical protein